MKHTHAVAILSGMLASIPAAASPEAEVAAAFGRFVAAQNAHDLSAVRALLLDDPTFLWVTRGNVIWGPEDALKRFQSLYEGTWSLNADPASTKVVMRGDSVAQLVSRVTFKIGAPGQPAIETPFVLTQVWVRTGSAWKVGSLLPIPVPPPPAPPPSK